MLYQQPQVGPASIDWSNPITRKISVQVVAGMYGNLVNQVTPIANTASITTTPQGRAFNFVGSNANYVTQANPITSGDYTLCAVFTYQGSTGVIAGLFDAVNGAAGQGHYISIESSGAIAAVTCSNTSSYYLANGPTAVAGKTYVIEATFAASGGRTLSVNGVLVASDATAATATNLNALSIGGYRIGPSTLVSPITGQISSVSVLNRIRLASETSTYSANPWQIFADEDDEDVYRTAVAGIAFDASSSSTYQTASSSYTFNRTITGTNTFLSVDVSLLGTATVTSVTDDSTGVAIPMSLLGTSTNGIRRVESWGLSGASTGTKTISVVLSAAVASAATSTSYTNVNQVISTEAFNGSTGTNAGSATDASVSVTTVADLCWVHAAIATDDTSITANQTSRSNVTGALGSGADEDNNAAVTPAGAVTMSYTDLGITAAWAMAGYALRPLSAAGGVFSSNGSSTGTSTVGSTARNIFTTAGLSIGSTTLTSVARAVAFVTGSSAGLASVTASSNSVFTSSGVSVGTSTVTAVSNTVFTVAASSSGSSNVNAVSNSVATTSGSSNGSVILNGVGNALATTTGNSAGNAVVNASAGSLYGVVGNSVGSSNVQATSVSITQTTASAIGSSTASAASVTIGTSNGSSTGSATLSGVGNAIWKVSGSSSGIAIVSGNGADAAGGTTTVSAAGSALGTSSVNATANALSQAIANAFGSSVVGAQGVLIAAVIANATGTSAVAATSGKVVFTSGSSTGSASVSATANSVANSVGAVAGTSSVQSAVLIIYQARGFAPGAADAQAAARAIQKAIGQSSGTCVVAGITQGGVHYIGKGDHLSVTLILSPYEITLNDTSFNIIKN